MRHLELALQVYESRGVMAALQAVSEELARAGGAAIALWVPPDDVDPVVAGAEPSASLAQLAREIRRQDAEIQRPLSADEAGLGPDLELVAVPASPGAGVFAVIGVSRAVGVEISPWRPVARAVAAVVEAEATRAAAVRFQEKAEALEAAERELRKSVEEGEILHTLGLAANRSLDPDEVLELVTRLTRTALGAAYVMLSTNGDGTTRTPTAVGVHGDPPARDPLADRVVHAGRVLRIGEGETLRPADFWPHADEGMVVGLGVPLSIYGDTIGALVIGYRRPIEITARHVRLALTLAGHAAVAISNARLHHALAQRTAEVQHAYDELRSGAEAKERFFASLSHELRTPVNAILGYHSLILEGVAGQISPTVEQFVRNAHRAADGLLHLVTDVLDLSKIEAGKVDLVLQTVRITDLLQDAVAAVNPMADKKGIVLEMLGEGDPEAVTDANLLRQIVVNLLSNAIKFTDAGRVRVSATVETPGPANARGAALMIAVEDTGPGIAEEDHQRIFQEFEQVGRGGREGGTGLGLPISRKLARLLGGDLSVRSRSGEGSIFTLALPLTGPTDEGTTLAPPSAEGGA